jgi:hypothetical protein
MLTVRVHKLPAVSPPTGLEWLQGFGPYAHLQCRLLRNIGMAFLQQGVYSDACDNFEAVLRIRPDMVSAYNRLIATYMITKSVEQSDALKRAFKDMLTVPGLERVGAAEDTHSSGQGADMQIEVLYPLMHALSA